MPELVAGIDALARRRCDMRQERHAAGEPHVRHRTENQGRGHVSFQRRSLIGHHASTFLDKLGA
jgi:hypothetical protein